MASVTLKPTSKYVLTNSAGQIYAQHDGGIVTYMRLVWFTVEPYDPVAGEVPTWMSVQDYKDVFIYKDRIAQYRFLTPSAMQKMTSNWRKKPKASTPNLEINNVRIGGPSPSPPSYIHTKPADGFLPYKCLLWGFNPAPPSTPFPILPTWSGGNFATNVNFTFQPKFRNVSRGWMVVDGMNGDTVDIVLWVVPVGGGEAIFTGPIPPGSFSIPYELGPLAIIHINNQDYGRVANIIGTATPFLEISSARYIWEYV